MLRVNKSEGLTEAELEFLAKLYAEVKDKTKSFQEYIEDYKKEKIDEYLRGQAEGKA